MALVLRPSCGHYVHFFRGICTNSVLRYGHYTTLGLKSSATQSEIKAAYYELCKKHHPDKNKGSEQSAKLFKKIQEAYEILGNEQLRKKYDLECSTGTSSYNHYQDPGPFYYQYDENFYCDKKKKKFTRKYYAYGKTDKFDFDAWYDAHYGKKNFYRYNSFTERNFNAEKRKDQDTALVKVEKLFLILSFILILLPFFTSQSHSRKKKKVSLKKIFVNLECPFIKLI